MKVDPHSSVLTLETAADKTISPQSSFSNLHQQVESARLLQLPFVLRVAESIPLLHEMCNCLTNVMEKQQFSLALKIGVMTIIYLHILTHSFHEALNDVENASDHLQA